MPPKIRRPAAAVPVAKGRPKAKAKPRVRRRGPQGPGALPLGDPPWIRIEDDPPLKWNVSEKIVGKVWYGGEEGLAHLLVLEDTQDAEGRWLGVQVLGTSLHQLRTWVLTQSDSNPRVYLAQSYYPAERRINSPGLGYLLEFRKALGEDQHPWMNNCLDKDRGPDPGNTGDLARVAAGLGYPMGAAPGFPPVPPPPPDHTGRSPSGDRPKKHKKKQKKKDGKGSGRARVRRMVEKSKWSPQDTPMDPAYKKPIKLRIRKRKASSTSSSSAGGSSSESSSEAGLGEEHRLRSISRKLPGYLARSAAKEAKRVLADAVGEDPSSFRVFHRYYRQLILPRGGSKGIQRELLTLAVLMDSLLEGNILGSMDIIAQRMKSLELLQQGSDVGLALQVELIPREMLGLTGDTEARYAYKEYTGESKLSKQLKGNSPAAGKGGWKGSGKDSGKEGKDPPFLQKGGKKGGDRFNQHPKGGKRAPESRVIEPEE